MGDSILMVGNNVFFGLLGTMQVRDETDTRSIGSAHQRTLLAMLLLRANRVVAAGELMAALWDGEEPDRPLQALRNHVMRLRQALGPELACRVRTQAPGYVFEVRPGELDVQRSAELLEAAQRAFDDGDWSGVSDAVNTALELWRGEPLSDIGSREVQVAYSEPLREERLRLRELRIDADLGQGRYGPAMAELESAIAAYPFRERLYGKLMAAFYGVGRQAEALALYRDCRTVLRDELGVEPGAELQLIHRAILSQGSVDEMLRVWLPGRLASPAPPAPSAPPARPAQTGEPVPDEAVPEPATRDEKARGRLTSTARRFASHAVKRPVLFGGALGTTLVIGMLVVSPLLARRPTITSLDIAAATSKSKTAKEPAPARTASPDGEVRYVGRVGSDDQILSTTNVDVPVLRRVTAGDALVVSLTLTATSAGPVTVTDSAGNTYVMVGDVVDAYWHRTMVFAAFHAKALSTADQISASYPRSSKYHMAIDEFRGIGGAVAQAGDSNVYDRNTSEFSTGAKPLTCAPGTLLVSVVATNTGPAPVFVSGWQTLPVLKLSSYRQTVAYDFITSEGRCAATGTTTAQWEAVAVVFRH